MQNNPGRTTNKGQVRLLETPGQVYLDYVMSV